MCRNLSGNTAENDGNTKKRSLSPILIVASVIYRDQCIYYLYYVICNYYTNVSDVCTDLYRYY